MKAPLVLIEVGCAPEGLSDPVITKADTITNVSIDWSQPLSPSFLAAAITVLREYRGDHPRIDEVLARLELLDSLRRADPVPEPSEPA